MVEVEELWVLVEWTVDLEAVEVELDLTAEEDSD